MCLSIETPKNNKLSIVSNGKLIIFRCPKIWANYILTIFSLNVGTPTTINFPFGTNEKLMVLSVPILKHFRVIMDSTKLRLYSNILIFNAKLFAYLELGLFLLPLLTPCKADSMDGRGNHKTSAVLGLVYLVVPYDLHPVKT